MANRLLEALFTPTAYRRKRDEEKLGETASSLSEIIGSSEVPGASYLPHMPGASEGDTDPIQATGLFQGAGQGQVTQLEQLKGLLGSGNPTLQTIAMQQYDEFVKPPTTYQPEQSPSSYKEYLLTDDTPTSPEYAEFLKTKNKSLGGIGDEAISLTDLAKIGIVNKQGVTRPLDNISLSAQDIQERKGLLEGESYVPLPTAAEAEYKRARTNALTIYSQLDDMLFSGDTPIFDEDYRTDFKGQMMTGIKWLTQKDVRFAEYIDYTKGVSGNLARSIGGEKGALREEDIQRVIQGLLPKLPHIGDGLSLVKGDTEKLARKKMINMKRLLRLPTKDLAKRLNVEFDKLNNPAAQIYVYKDGKIVEYIEE